MRYDLIFISTCTSLSHVHYLLSSIASNNESLRVHVIILFQCGFDLDVVYDTSYTTIH